MEFHQSNEKSNNQDNLILEQGKVRLTMLKNYIFKHTQQTVFLLTRNQPLKVEICVACIFALFIWSFPYWAQKKQRWLCISVGTLTWGRDGGGPCCACLMTSRWRNWRKKKKCGKQKKKTWNITFSASHCWKQSKSS